MIPLYIDVANRVARKSPYDATPLLEIDLRAGDTQVFNLYYMNPTVDPRGPFAITRFQSAANSMQLLDAGNTAVATQGTWTELVPAVTGPTITRVVSWDATHGEYDRITLASPPGSGNLALVLTGGAVSKLGATSASAKVYPGITSEAEVAAAFAAMLGAPYSISFVAPTLIDVHGSAIAGGGVVSSLPHIAEVNVANLQYLFGYTASLDLTGAGVTAIAAVDGNTPELSLLVKLTPSGGAASSVLKLPVNLST